MTEQRLAELNQRIQSNPNDPSHLYNLAVEYVEVNPIKALEIFQQLLTEFEDYIPTYMPTAKLYEASKDFPHAFSTYEKGLGICMLHRNNDAYKELQKAYHRLALELED